MVFRSFHFPRVPSTPPFASSLQLLKTSPDSIITSIDTGAIRSISLGTRLGKNVITISTGDSTYRYLTDTMDPVHPVNEDEFMQIASEYCNAGIIRIDTLTEVDQWIPFERWSEQMPIYKYHFNDTDRHELYMTDDGKVIQMTDRKSRYHAWIGAIPHWLYFTPLRKHQKAWTDFVIWAALLGCIMCLSGIAVAIIVWWKQRKHGLWHCPYRKFWWRWHFISGMLFGWCAITFAFSGYMSMTDLPAFLKKEPDKLSQNQGNGESKRRDRPNGNRRNGNCAPLESYRLDVNKVIEESGDSLVEIKWMSWNDYPYYKLIYRNSSVNIDARIPDRLCEFILTEAMIHEDVQQNYPGSFYSISPAEDNEGMYMSHDNGPAQPTAYKVTLPDNGLHPVVYYDTHSLSKRRVDDNSRLKNLLYQKLHSLKFAGLYEHKGVWYAVMFILLTGGTLLSVTGVYLSLSWIIHQLRKIRIS